jgi:hypothetical protein
MMSTEKGGENGYTWIKRNHDGPDGYESFEETSDQDIEESKADSNSDDQGSKDMDDLCDAETDPDADETYDVQNGVFVDIASSRSEEFRAAFANAPPVISDEIFRLFKANKKSRGQYNDSRK